MKNAKKSSAVQIARLRVSLAQKALERRSRELIEAAPDAIVVVDRAGRIVLVNAQTEDLFGYPREELLGMAIEMLVPESARAGHVEKRDRFIGHPSVRPMGTGLDLAGRRKDGTEVPIEISLSPLHTDAGVLVSASIRDITERREAQQALHEARNELELRVRERTAELEQANAALQAEMADRHAAELALHQAQKMEAVGQLTGGVAHDFNNLLTVVMGNLQLLARRVQGDAAADELIKGALKAAKRGADLNRTLLAFSRKQRLAPVPVDFNEMIAGMASLLRRSLGEQVQIMVAESADLPRAMADVTQLESALLNLAVNSRDAMPQGGTLTIETAAVRLDEHYAALESDVNPGPYVMLAVSDTGTGMPPEVAARAFEPFFTTKDTGKGSGLGLAMVYGFVKQSGGHVKIYSEPGMGTTVKLFLPELTSPIDFTATTAEAPVPQPTGRETILVVEDEEDVRHLVCRLLTALGYRILEASHGKAAITILDAEPDVDLLFTDVVLPGGMNGPEIARQAQLRRPGLKVLYTSGYTGNAIQQLEALGSEVRLISKPYAIEDLAQTVRDTLDA
ncbi:PAS domain S-box protein [Aromatoleum diolicum]|uniref:histidine kinase n=2 Tax=Aromatoleum diolicum TaxID=75796 RepID=A0ABX1Q8G6_9RHOO|nr:PAS domain S-box protein [Aromatoleum diolicum]